MNKTELAVEDIERPFQSRRKCRKRRGDDGGVMKGGRHTKTQGKKYRGGTSSGRPEASEISPEPRCTGDSRRMKSIPAYPSGFRDVRCETSHPSCVDKDNVSVALPPSAMFMFVSLATSPFRKQ